jgi:serine/threonine-protein kinase RsbT
MAVQKHETMPIRAASDIVLVRQTVRSWAAELGFSLVDQTKLVTAASELARNTLEYGGGGTVRLEALNDSAGSLPATGSLRTARDGAAGRGTTLRTLRTSSSVVGARRGLRLTFEDQGPGIPDVELALRDGYTTGSGLGLGLSGSKRLVNEFELESRVGEGTRVTITRWK